MLEFTTSIFQQKTQCPVHATENLSQQGSDKTQWTNQMHWNVETIADGMLYLVHPTGVDGEGALMNDNSKSLQLRICVEAVEVHSYQLCGRFPRFFVT